MKKILVVCTICIVVALAACKDEIEPPPIPLQHWKEVGVRIETRPNPPKAGMSEVVVIATAGGRPVYDLIVSLRTTESAPWVQTIQDGHIGVYRRGVGLGFGESVVLQVLLQNGKEQQVLYFPLKLTAD